MNPTPLLDAVNLPQDLRLLDKSQLPQLCAELRAFLLESVGKTGGHFASNLGAVELAVALHYVYDTPRDHLVWDVGHQSYPHKILTGRRGRMHTLRQFGGLAGFPKRSESEYDDFGVGHSSTSIGAALGMAVADRLLGRDTRSVAVIGDGAMTAGQAFEALNCAGDMADTDLLVILNDNEMSISPNVGALPKYLARNVMRDMRGVLHNIKSQSAFVLDKLPAVKEIAQKQMAAPHHGCPHSQITPPKKRCSGAKRARIANALPCRRQTNGSQYTSGSNVSNTPRNICNTFVVRKSSSAAA